MTEKIKEREAVLESVPLFSELAPAELRALAQCAVARRYARGELVFSEGDACEGLYVIESGAVRIFKTSASGREQILGLERAVSTVAELPVFDGGSYPASVDAAEDSTLLLIRREDFQQLCLRHPEVAIKVLRVVGRRLRRLVTICGGALLHDRAAPAGGLAGAPGETRREENATGSRAVAGGKPSGTGGTYRHGARVDLAQPEPTPGGRPGRNFRQKSPHPEPEGSGRNRVPRRVSRRRRV